jgi:hypothetical protein
MPQLEMSEFSRTTSAVQFEGNARVDEKDDEHRHRQRILTALIIVSAFSNLYRTLEH